VVGLVYGLLFNRFGVPSFVITLAGLLVLLGLLMVTGLWTRLMSSLQGVMANVQLPL